MRSGGKTETEMGNEWGGGTKMEPDSAVPTKVENSEARFPKVGYIFPVNQTRDQ